MKVVAILVTYNAAVWYKDCIESLLTTIPARDIVVVDNNSTDGTKEMIKSDFPDVLLIGQKENLGFGRANNIGISKALKLGAEYLFLINQDAAIEADTLSILIEVDIASNGRYGILSPVHYYNENELDRLFASYTHKPKRKIKITTGSSVSDIKVVPFVNAAMWLIKREKVLEVGGFNPLFGHYGEDDDYVNRMRYYGYEVAVVESARGYHYRSQIKKPLTEERYIFKQIKNNNINWQNVNNSLTTLLSQSICFNGKKAIRYLISRDSTKAKFHLRQIFYLFLKGKEIVRLRHTAKSGNAPFLK